MWPGDAFLMRKRKMEALQMIPVAAAEHECAAQWFNTRIKTDVNQFPVPVFERITETHPPFRTVKRGKHPRPGKLVEQFFPVHPDRQSRVRRCRKINIVRIKRRILHRQKTEKMQIAPRLGVRCKIHRQTVKHNKMFPQLRRTLPGLRQCLFQTSDVAFRLPEHQTDLTV